MITGPYDQMTIGETIVTNPTTLRFSDIYTFGHVTQDCHPLHLDPEYAAKTRFGQPIAHGALMLSLALGLMDFDARYAIALYGIDDVRFTAPTFVGDDVRARSVIVAIDPKDDGGSAVVTGKVELTNHRDQLVLTGTIKALVSRTPHEG